MSAAEREDLAALLTRAARRLSDAEAPVLAGHKLSMWEYIVLSQLARRPAPNQLTLAREIGHDKTRLIKLLDRLQERGLIDRRPDATDRRSRTVTLTDQGRTLHTTVRAAIRAMEDEQLTALDADERRILLAVLPKLASPEG